MSTMLKVRSSGYCPELRKEMAISIDVGILVNMPHGMDATQTGTAERTALCLLNLIAHLLNNYVYIFTCTHCLAYAFQHHCVWLHRQL